MPEDKKNEYSDSEVAAFVNKNPQFADYFNRNPIPKLKGDAAYKASLITRPEGSMSYEAAKEINEAGGASNPNLYRDPESINRYAHVLFRPSSEDEAPKVTNLSRSYIDRYNQTFGKKLGYYLDPETPSLRKIASDDPTYKQLESKYSSTQPGVFGKGNYDKSDVIKFAEGPYIKNKSTGKYEKYKIDAQGNPIIISGTAIDYKPQKFTSTESEKSPESYYRQVESVEPSYDNSYYSVNDKGETRMNKPGRRFRIKYHDGSTKDIDEAEYEKWKGFNKLPASIKSKYVEQVDLSKQPEDYRKRVEGLMKARKSMP